MGFVLFLILVNVGVYGTLAAPGYVLLCAARRMRAHNAGWTALAVTIIGGSFAPAFVGFGHLPVIVPFVISPLVDRDQHRYTAPNAGVAIAAAIVAGGVTLRRRRAGATP